MNKFWKSTIQLLKTRWLIILLAVIIVLIFIVKQQTKKLGKVEWPAPSPKQLLSPLLRLEPTPTPSISWRGVIINQTSQDELKEQLGAPLKQEIQEGFEIQSYPSANKYRLHEITLSQNKIVFIKEQIIDPSEKNLKEFTQKYGHPEKILYNELFKVGFAVHIYPIHGLAVIANPNDGTVLEVWYFESMTLGRFLQTWGKNLTSSPPEAAF